MNDMGSYKYRDPALDEARQKAVEELKSYFANCDEWTDLEWVIMIHALIRKFKSREKALSS